MDFREYLRSFNSYPRLSAEEEADLAARAKAGDKRARERLFRCSLRWAAQVAQMEHAARRMSIEDAFSECCYGMTYALTKFDPALGRFSTYSVPWMRCMLGRFERPSEAVTWPKSSKFTKFRRDFARDNGRTEETRSELLRRLAAKFRSTEDQVTDWAALIESSTSSLDAPVADGVSLIDLFPSAVPNPCDVVVRDEEQRRLRKEVRRALAQVSARERMILERTVMQEEAETNQAIASEVGLSRERVRQLRAKATEKVEKTLRKARAA